MPKGCEARIYCVPHRVNAADDELTITAPKILTKPWKTTRVYFRQRLRRVDILEGTCLEGYFKPAVDKDGYQIFEPVPHDVGGNRIPPKN
ncbi:MAG: hypothetical protein ABIS45_11190 [Burkholderiales bacterium]